MNTKTAIYCYEGFLLFEIAREHWVIATSHQEAIRVLATHLGFGLTHFKYDHFEALTFDQMRSYRYEDDDTPPIGFIIEFRRKLGKRKEPQYFASTF